MLSDQELRTILVGCKLNERKAQKALYTYFFSSVMTLTLEYAPCYDFALALANDSFLAIFEDLVRSLNRRETVPSFTVKLRQTTLRVCENSRELVMVG